MTSVALTLGAIFIGLVLVVVLSIVSRKHGGAIERERQQRQTIDNLEEANRVARDVHRRRASDRLRDEWTTRE